MHSEFHYFNVGEPELATGLYLTSAGRTSIPPGRDYPPPGHPEDYAFSWGRGRVLTDTALVFILRGRGQFETRAGSFTWVAGQAVLLPPGLWHRYRPDRRTGWTELWLTLSGDVLGRLWQQWEGRVAIQPLRMRRPAAFTRDFQALLDTALKRRRTPAGAGQPLTWVASGLSLVGRFVEQHPTETTVPVSDDLVERARRFIWNHAHRPLTVQQVAGAAGVNRRTLERHFADTLGRTVRQELEWHRVQRARKLIAQTSRPIKEIAFLCGFREPRGLIRASKRWLETTPGSLRAAKPKSAG